MDRTYSGQQLQYLCGQGAVSLVEVAADARQPDVTAVSELPGTVHLEHLAHVLQLGPALDTGQLHRVTRLPHTATQIM